MLKKSIFLSAFLISGAALASNPSDCIAPNNLFAAAESGLIHNVTHVKKPDQIKLNQWYTVGSGYSEDMRVLKNPSNQWIAGDIGYKDANGELCDYEVISGPDANTYEDIQKMFKRPSALNAMMKRQ